MTKAESNKTVKTNKTAKAIEATKENKSTKVVKTKEATQKTSKPAQPKSGTKSKTTVVDTKNNTTALSLSKYIKDNVNINILRLTDTATVPTKAHSTDACFDLYVDEPDALYTPFPFFWKSEKGIKIKPHSTVALHSGIATEIPQGFFCAIYPRSGLGIRQNLRLPNSTGIIDADYRGEWVIALYNDSNKTRIIHHGDRVAQFAVLPVLNSSLTEVSTLNNTERGKGGFGSSGKN